MIKISFLLFLLLQTILSANLQDDIKYECPTEYETYKEDISKYLIRIEDDIADKGCEVIPVYAAIIQSQNFEILDSLEDDSNLMNQLMKLFSINKELSSLIFENSGLKQIILSNSLNEKFVDNFSYLMNKNFHKKDLRKIKKNGEYLNYYLLSAFYARDKKDSNKLYKKIKSSISIELMPSFTFILSAIGDEYQFRDLVENFSTIQNNLSTDAIKKLAEYPKYFIYFLYPSKNDLEIDTISKSMLKKIQIDMQKKVIFFYKSMFDKYRYMQGVNQLEYALLSVEYIYPYLLEQHDIEYDDFVKVCQTLVNQNYILTLFSHGKCSNKTKENFAIFGQNNIYAISKFLKHESRFSNKLFKNLGKSPNAIFSFFYVANFYNSSNSDEWYLFKDLVKSLPFANEEKIAFLKRLEKNGYFRNIVTQRDYKSIVKAEDGNYPKYKYILVTPYPSQTSTTLFEQILTTNISDEKLKESLFALIQKDVDELAEHRFTTFEKFAGNMETIEKIDDALFVASIVAAPFTGGASLSYVAMSSARKASQKATKMGFKYMLKKVELQGRKIVNKAVRQARKGRKVVDRKVGIHNRNRIGKALDSHPVQIVGDIGNTSAAIGIGTGLYLYFNHTQLAEKTICTEQ